jgi:DNA-binding SARP family transcriptional activator
MVLRGPGSVSTLPFVLLESAPAPAVTFEPDSLSLLLDRLDVLRDLALETRRDLDLLRRESAQILIDLGAVALRADNPSEPEQPASSTHPVSNKLAIRLLGSFEVRFGGRVLSAWPSKKARLLLAYLALEPGRLAPKDVLVELFWPGVSPARGANNLSIAVHQLRSALKEALRDGSHGITVQQGLYGLDPETAWVDVQEFRSLMAKARPSLEKGDGDRVREYLTAALALYRGDFLESDPYEEWAEEPRRSLSMLLGRALAWLAEDAAANRDWQKVLDCATRMLQRDGCDEAGYRWSMLAYWRTGNRVKALQQYELCVRQLEAELGARPADETSQLYQRVRGDA